MQAWRTKCLIRREIDGDEEQLYQKIIPTLRRMRGQQDNTDDGQLHDGAFVAWRTAPNDRFQALLVLPFPWLRAFRHVRKFFTLDGAHLSSAYGGVLLTAACLDGNDQIILLEWAIVPQESDEGWRGFYYWKAQLVSFESFASDRSQNIAFFSDRAKGLIAAVGEAFPRAHHYHCTQHLVENFHLNYGDRCSNIFRRLVFAQNEGEYKALRRRAARCATEGL